MFMMRPKRQRQPKSFSRLASVCVLGGIKSAALMDGFHFLFVESFFPVPG